MSTADPRFTLQWPKNLSQNDFRIDTCIQPVDLPTFAQFCKHFSHECQGLLGVGPIIELNYDDITLLKPMQLTLPILVQPKKKTVQQKPTTDDPNNPPQTTTSQSSQQETILKSMLSEG
jgi:hypothetical protein